jgi:hypothetical protein
MGATVEEPVTFTVPVAASPEPVSSESPESVSSVLQAPSTRTAARGSASSLSQRRVVEFTEWTLLGFVLLVMPPTDVASDLAEGRDRGLTSSDGPVNDG